MFAIQINHPRADERRAQISLAEAIGNKIFHNDAGASFVVTENGAHCRRASLIPIVTIPESWIPGAAEPIGGWESI